MEKKDSIPSKLGVFMAHVQGFTDEFMGLVFTGLKNLEESEPEKSKKTKKSSTMLTLFKGALWFLGEMGDSYYKKYEDIKELQKKRRSVDE